MPRISDISNILQGEASDALEWIVGDVRTFTGTVYVEGKGPDTANPEKQDLTSAVLTLTFEFYTANVTAGSGRATTLAISALQLDSTLQKRILNATVAADQVANKGEFSVIFPADLYAANPAADLAESVPVAIVYLQRTQGGQVYTTRFVVVFRRGKPS